MNLRRTLAASAFFAFAVPIADAHADCIDPYECVCLGSVVTVMGRVRQEPPDAGSAGMLITVERVGTTGGGTPALKVDDVATVRGAPLPVGTRVLATADVLADRDLRLMRALNGSSVSCSGETFQENEVVELAFASDCRSRVGDRIETDCDDTDGPLCHAGSSARSRGSRALFVPLALVAFVAAFRLARRR